MKIDFNKLKSFPRGTALPALRCAIATALGRDEAVSHTYLGSLLGFKGSKISKNILQLETGQRELQGSQILLGTMILQQCLLHHQEYIVIPEWTTSYPVDPGDDANQIILTHNWFPAFQVLAIPVEYEPIRGYGQHFGFVGSSRDPFDTHQLYWNAALPLPVSADYATFLATATDAVQALKEEDYDGMT